MSLDLLAAVASLIACAIGLVLVLMVGEVIDLLNDTRPDEDERERIRRRLRHHD